MLGRYLYGMFPEDAFLRSFLANLGATPGHASYDQTVEETLDALADHFATHVDRSRLLALAQAQGGRYRPPYSAASGAGAVRDHGRQPA